MYLLERKNIKKPCNFIIFALSAVPTLLYCLLLNNNINVDVKLISENNFNKMISSGCYEYKSFVKENYWFCVKFIWRVKTE